jgi:site-specific DNA-methyltransferase (adenine-specific)
MIGMSEYPDKHFDLAVVDPPYGINASEMTMGSGKNKKYKKGKFWDKKKPDEIYFTELFRVSKNQIIWGGNYFILPISKCWIFWDKGIYGDTDFADGELAWTSFDKVLRIAKIRYRGILGSDDIRIHPTQKPVKLYDWILTHYAKPGMNILDTHVGSG